MKKYFYINNLDCANCARVIEKELMKSYENVTVNFNTSKLIIESDKNINL